MVSKTRVFWYFFVLCFFYISKAYSAAYQIFPTLAYENAANLNLVNKYTAIIGTTDLVVRMKYTGIVGSTFGSAVSDTNTVLPYLRLASRLDPKWVTSFDVSHPLLGNVSYPTSSFVDPAGTDAIIIDTNYSFKVSYELMEALALGIGFDANNVSNAEVNFGERPTRKALNKSHGWGYGWDAGIAFTLNEFNHFNFSYYSEIDFPELRGVSTLGSIYKSNFSDDLVAPTTFTLNAIHQVTPKWELSEIARFVLWGEEKELTLTNSVVGDLAIPLNYQDIWSLLLAAKYQFSESWAGSVLAEYQANAQSIIYRPIVLPTTSLVIGGAMLDYAASSMWSAQLRYAYIYANPGIDRKRPIKQKGHVKVGVNIMDVGLTWKM